MAAEDRRGRVLEAIVRDYVTTREPVGSKALVERYALGVSPATVRNDMAVLEEAGLLTHPHTSAGRIPTDAGYRAFVDSLTTVKPLSRAERRAISQILDAAVDLDDVLDRAARLLSHLTQQVAVIQYPALDKAVLRHLELIWLGATRILLVVITSAGRVEQRVIAVPAHLEGLDVDAVSREVTTRCNGQPLTTAVAVLAEIAERSEPEAAAALRDIAAALTTAVHTGAEDRLTMAGTANLSRHSVDFLHSISPVLDALEEQVVLLRLLAAMETDVAVSIGAENDHENLSETSVVSSSYEVAGHEVARVGVVGPTRMDYPGNIAAVRAVAHYLSGILSGQS
ncbi:heat-inducible transcriptional repressor HrcA [Actinotignum sanguinis]|uniref:Heat-inducible transcription repressor HrcA n=2 Tax=Actinomycetaceae TaxID=2049 RepID=A0ABZ0RCX3_9ACTO|nr:MULTISPECIES: heat-inducible transcriptional repressor HrcA [Actinotignum]WPJ89733.1 heat-inducible transcriptional repressor HrcA [Schaalia turicensis]MDE1552104.1 heat-inducible transcriptional repressor HrcA [Actinotignum sanguinis]MDE1565229.1 heat-inducible transcriptional repressor HrcA [Actinotignum sanguinis]MDE1577440.1 heat-inducible transcriptional repressor HrcA [Actinotignum sanguinis]MDE1642242.1 heat-inducible transcriptional repressor HrcA [Actinotignum sanguinis]